MNFFNHKLLSPATIIVNTTSGFSIYLRYFTDVATDGLEDSLSFDPLKGSSKVYDGYGRSMYNQLSCFSGGSHISRTNSYSDILVDYDHISSNHISHHSKLVRSTTASIADEGGHRRYLIVEEAARLSEHEFASFLVAPFDKIILLGDILQLPPLIQDLTIASSGALDWSVFHRICYSPRISVPIVALEEQARTFQESF
ncbi:Superfamily I DNA helicase [Giardia duodenalis]|uniref:Superfamily I DNA helicase n=1 Tax=Giardia intestinalis TaxID=5741 RepID=V6TBA8_GIAIN|nr:Superfamily I DNA helicase [Giardia intestinalis]